MAQRLTQEDFIARARKIHGDKYDYSQTDFKGMFYPISIICPVHGTVWQRANHHLNTSGCPKCGGRYMDEEYFLQRAKEVHGDKYDYSKVNYVNTSTKVCIICPVHGEFWQTPNGHLGGKGCKKCANDKLIKSLASFIEEAKGIHKNKYDYSLVEYRRCNNKVKIICPIHGVFEQTPNAHLRGDGCPTCGKSIKRKTTEQFIIDARQKHGDKYDYSKVEYRQSFEKVTIICPVHGEYQQTPNHHLEGAGCPRCSHSQGEMKIEKFLREHDITFVDQYKITLREKLFGRNECLWVDFYLPQEKTIIEFNGIQHYKEVGYFHKGDDGFVKQRYRDERLKKWSKDNNINLVIIKYDQIDDIENLLSKLINSFDYETNQAKKTNA